MLLPLGAGELLESGLAAAPAEGDAGPAVAVAMGDSGAAEACEGGVSPVGVAVTTATAGRGTGAGTGSTILPPVSVSDILSGATVCDDPQVFLYNKHESDRVGGARVLFCA